jgi:outer membrane protein assembly factor BamB
LIFVVSQSGRLAAFSGQSGLLVWEQLIGSIEMPWLSGKTLFVMGHDGRLYAVRRSDGAVRWIAALPDATPPDVVVTENPPRYVGPIVAGNMVLVISKSGQVHMFDPDNGAEIGTKSLGMAVLTPPQIAAGKLLVLDVNGTLSAFE